MLLAMRENARITPVGSAPSVPWVDRWLWLCVGLVLLMVAVGGLTRLTESGLSMTDWRPVTGWLPPLSEEAWQEAFSAYRETPEYRYKNFDFTLVEYQRIFWLEYLHRLLGRLIGLVFFLPWLFFTLTKRIPARLAFGLGGIFLLGGMQGAVGWIMVASGLEDVPYVNPVKLALHLGMAAFIYMLLLRVLGKRFWKHRLPAEFIDSKMFLKKGLWGIALLVFAQMLLGALVAGWDAGLLYNSFPLMDGRLIPENLWVTEAGWGNLIANPTWIQFVHRMMAWLLALVIPCYVWFAWRRAPLMVRPGLGALVGLLTLQFTLGVLTVLYGVPLAVASLHQIGAFLLLGVAVFYASALDKS